MATGCALVLYTCGERANVPRQLADAGSLTQIIIFLAVRDTAKSCTHMLKPIVAEFTNKKLRYMGHAGDIGKSMTSTERLFRMNTDRNKLEKRLQCAQAPLQL